MTILVKIEVSQDYGNGGVADDFGQCDLKSVVTLSRENVGT